MTKETVSPVFTERELAAVHTAVRNSEFVQNLENNTTDEWQRLWSFGNTKLSRLSQKDLEWFTTRDLVVIDTIIRNKLNSIGDSLESFVGCVTGDGLNGLDDYWWWAHGEEVDHSHITRENFALSKSVAIQEFEELLEDEVPLTTAMVKIAILMDCDSRQREEDARAFHEGQ